MVGLLGTVSRETLTATFNKCFSPFVYFYHLISLSYYILVFSSFITCTFTLEGRSCVWVFTLLLVVVCEINIPYSSHPIVWLNLLPFSTQYFLLIVPCELCLLLTFLSCLLWHVSKSIVALWIKVMVLKTTLSPQLVLLLYLIFSTSCFELCFEVVLKYGDLNFEITGLNHIIVQGQK